MNLFFAGKVAFLLALLLLPPLPPAAMQSPPASATEAMYQAAAKSAEAKFDYVQENASRAHPDPHPTVFTEREINSYLSSGQVRLPQGVRSVRFSLTPGMIQGRALVDFDAITAKQGHSNLFAALFTGVHEVEAGGRALGSNGRGQVHVEHVAIDGVPVPRIALEFFIDHYLQPKHPEIGLDSNFPLPERIDTAAIGPSALTLIQK